ncbi:MAG TPA: HAMP domain-containing sensor histidine kinase [Vicinamibacterales bacterium]|nr:HAMP domain-containing sensor histidine kinase [Vicinamibacterales bacterium]
MSSKWADRVSQALGLRLAAWYLGTFLASTLVIGGLTYGLLSTLLETRDHDIIQSTLREYATRYQAGGLPALARAIEIEQRSGTREPLFVRVIGPFEDVLLYSLPETWGAFELSELPGGPNEIWSQVRARDRNAVLEIATINVGGGSFLQVGKTSEARNQLLSNFRRVLMLGAGAALVIGMVGGLFLTRSTLKPLRDLRDAVRRILQTGQTDDRVPVYGTEDTVDELSTLFNAMLARITTLIHGMRNALDHVAHDLRTPMTRLRVTAESALATNDPVKHREALLDCLEESERVLSMLTTLMDISEAETGTMRLKVTQVDVTQLAAEVTELYEDTAEDAGVALHSGVPAGLTVPADRDRLRQALANLVDNAIKYTPRGGRVDITASAEGSDIVLRIADTGPGISEQDLPRIFDRLYRGDHSRATRGLGLGLSLVRAYVTAQGGSVSVESQLGKGSTFIIRLPAFTTITAM